VGDGVISKLGKEGEVIGVEIISLSKTSKEDLAGLPPETRKAMFVAIRKLSMAAAGLS